jgi:hypothetical protein
MPASMNGAWSAKGNSRASSSASTSQPVRRALCDANSRSAGRARRSALRVHRRPKRVEVEHRDRRLVAVPCNVMAGSQLASSSSAKATRMIVRCEHSRDYARACRAARPAPPRCRRHRGSRAACGSARRSRRAPVARPRRGSPRGRSRSRTLDVARDVRRAPAPGRRRSGSAGARRRWPPP